MEGMGGFFYSISSEALKVVSKSQEINWAIAVLLGASGEALILPAKTASLLVFFIGFLVMVYGLSVPRRRSIPAWRQERDQLK